MFIFYREVHTEMRGKLKDFLKPTSVASIIWSFKPNSVFKNFNYFLKRLHQIKDIFLIAVEFQKLEKVIIGGLRSREVNRKLKLVMNDINQFYFTEDN